MDRETRIRLINQTLAEYFRTHSDKVPAINEICWVYKVI